MTRTTKITKATTKVATSTPQTRAAEEGVLDARVRELDPARWPTALRVRYVGDQPVSGPAELVEPLTVEEATGD